jgi:hypothetical protein
MTRHKLLEVPIERNRVREVSVGTTIVRGALGPLDFPEQVRVSFDDASPQNATLDFVYAMAPEEPEDERRLPDGNRVCIGRKSGRILRMTLKVPEGAKGLKLSVETDLKPILRDLAASAQHLRQPPRRLAHYQMVGELLPWLDQKIAELRAGARRGPADGVLPPR